MGWERDYQALPDGCYLLERAKVDPDFGQHLCFIRMFFQRHGQPLLPNPDEALIDFCQAVRSLIELYPGIEKRYYTLDRYFDMVHYLISAWKRGDRNADPNDMGTKAICGTTELPKHLIGTQGFSIRYSTSDDVQEIALTLASLTQDDLRLRYDHVRMEKFCYKFWADRADDATWSQIYEYFEGLRGFYLNAAEHNEGVIALQD
jgi:hypothetical protein